MLAREAEEKRLEAQRIKAQEEAALQVELKRQREFDKKLLVIEHDAMGQVKK